MNYTPIDISGNTPPKKKSLFKNPIILGFVFLISSLVVIFALLGQRRTIQNRAAPETVRWCRDNSFGAGISAPSDITTEQDGTFSFTARLPSEADEACVTIADRLDENVVAGLPGATRRTTCVSPITSNADCSVGLSWDGRYGKDPLTLRVNGRVTGSECRLYLLSILGVPSCSRASVSVTKAVTVPTPTEIPFVTITPAKTPTPTPTKKPTPTPTKTPTPTPTNTPTPTVSPTPFPTGQPTPTPTNTPTPTLTPTPTPILIVQATNTPGPSATGIPPTVIVQTTPSIPQAGSVLPAAMAFALASFIIVLGLVL